MLSDCSVYCLPRWAIAHIATTIVGRIIYFAALRLISR